MATDFNKVLYATVAEHMKNQLGEEEYKKLDKLQWRKLMDDVMEHFARALVSIVVQVAHQQVQARAAAVEAEAAKNAAEPTPAHETPPAPPATA